MIRTAISRRRAPFLSVLAAAAAVVAAAAGDVPVGAQRAPGHSIGKVTIVGKLVRLELDTGVISPERLFDLDHRTLRFTPDGAGYRIENVPLVWDAELGAALTTPTMTIERFHFPFSGRAWDTLTVAIGAITFGSMESPGTGGARGGVPAGNRTGAGTNARAGFPMERYPTLETVGRTFINTIPGIAAFVKPNLSGQRYVKQLGDRVVITWTLTEPFAGIQAFTWTPTVNRIQAALYKNGNIELSYSDVSARDAVVGVFPTVTAGISTTIATIRGRDDASAPAHLGITRLRLDAIDGLFLRATVETRGPALAEGDTALNGVTYRIGFDREARSPGDVAKSTVVWTIRGVAGGRGGRTRYVVSGAGADADVAVRDNMISIKGVLPLELSGAREVFVSADASNGASIADHVARHIVPLASIRSPEIDLSRATKRDGPFTVAYEGFHWPAIPRSQDVACSVINTLGDKFDFIATYSDFRVDNPEAGTPSTGPRGGNVSGIGSSTSGLENYCSRGELQWMYVEPVSTSAVQIQERSPDGRMTGYNYAMSQIGHELGHRWAADARALVNGETITLGPVHWATGLQIPAAFPYSNPVEADAMGGSTWKDNGDGTYAQLDRDYYSPAKGYSWLGLYLMGLAKPEEVPPFFILRNLERTGQQDGQGHPIYKADKTVITINDVIAAMGPRVPDAEHSQKQFNTAIVVMTLPGKQATSELLSAANAIADHWISYWSKTTGGRSTMTVNPQ
ncbi:MAG TPA: hypothetical protein VHV78_15025 [Gemmatimonadaceae bacterium]|jgi:hypothetical protein|nr:hypothetical protein [Gemmatimonadaceae bacterium]